MMATHCAIAACALARRVIPAAPAWGARYSILAVGMAEGEWRAEEDLELISRRGLPLASHRGVPSSPMEQH